MAEFTMQGLDGDTNTSPVISVFDSEQPDFPSYWTLYVNQIQTAVAVIGIFSNTAVLLVFALSKRMKTTYFNMLIVNQVCEQQCLCSHSVRKIVVRERLSNVFWLSFSECCRPFLFYCAVFHVVLSDKPVYNTQWWVACRTGV